MIIVAGDVLVRADKREEALALAGWFAEQSELEGGCISYRFYTSIADPNVFHIFEEWETAVALATHFQTPHMAEFNAQLPNYLAGEPDVKEYEVSAIL